MSYVITFVAGCAIGVLGLAWISGHAVEKYQLTDPLVDGLHHHGKGPKP